MDLKTVVLKKEEGIATITMNRPDVLNAVDDELVADLTAALDNVAGDKQVRVMILTGAGRAFCAGAQIMKGGGRMLADLTSTDAEGLRQNIRAVQVVPRKLYNMEIPTIAMVNGPAVGAGFSLALACDMRVGCEKTRFRVSFTKLGLIPGTGDTWLLPRVVSPAKATEILFLADFVEAEEAHKIGILNKLTTLENLESETMTLAQRLAQGPPIALKLDKMLMHKGMNMDLDTSLEMIAACAPMGLSSEDMKEGVLAFVEKREPHFQGK